MTLIIGVPANWLLRKGRNLGNRLGYELAVDVSDHSIEIQMVRPNKDKRAWDHNLYTRGNLFCQGYANPIKPKVHYNQTLDDPDTVDVVMGDGGVELDEEIAEKDDGPHIELISSPRYRDYMRQDLISQLLTPQEQWKLLAYAVGALALVMLINLVVSLSAAGAF